MLWKEGLVDVEGQRGFAAHNVEVGFDKQSLQYIMPSVLCEPGIMWTGASSRSLHHYVWANFQLLFLTASGSACLAILHTLNINSASLMVEYLPLVDLIIITIHEGFEQHFDGFSSFSRNFNQLPQDFMTHQEDPAKVVFLIIFNICMISPHVRADPSPCKTSSRWHRLPRVNEDLVGFGSGWLTGFLKGGRWWWMCDLQRTLYDQRIVEF